MTGAAHRGLTMIEAVVSLVIISVLGLASLRALSAATLSRALAEDRARAVLLAGDLMHEILARPYAQPPATPASVSDRSGFNDTGDYNGWTGSPPATPTGAALAPALWRREVTVTEVSPADIAAPSPGSGLSLITVRIFKGDRLIASEQCLRSAAWDDAIDGGGP